MSHNRIEIGEPRGDVAGFLPVSHGNPASESEALIPEAGTRLEILEQHEPRPSSTVLF